MKYVTDYKEFDEEANASLLDNISDTSIEKKQVILDYLNNGNDAGVCCSAIFDFVQNESTGKTIHRYTDGEYIWDDREIYHFEHYNLELNKDFLDKVLENNEAS